MELEQAVEEYVAFIRVPHPELPYEERERLKIEKLRAMILALNRRKACAA